MIYVNTSLDVALERNASRPRSIPEPIVTKSWKDVQQNLGKFSQFFKQGLVIVDNNDAGDDVLNLVSKQIRGLVKKKVNNGRALQWIRNELDKKKRK
jgi:tRNA uridine 5-carbamoylmethylation protein Kti12